MNEWSGWTEHPEEESVIVIALAARVVGFGIGTVKYLWRKIA